MLSLVLKSSTTSDVSVITLLNKNIYFINTNFNTYKTCKVKQKNINESNTRIKLIILFIKKKTK